MIICLKTVCFRITQNTQVSILTQQSMTSRVQSLIHLGVFPWVTKAGFKLCLLPGLSHYTNHSIMKPKQYVGRQESKLITQKYQLRKI